MVISSIRFCAIAALHVMCFVAICLSTTAQAETFVIRGDTKIDPGESAVIDEPASGQQQSNFMAVGGSGQTASPQALSDSTCFGSECNQPAAGGAQIYSEHDIKLIGELEALRREHTRIAARIKQVEDMLEGRVPVEGDTQLQKPKEGKQKRQKKAAPVPEPVDRVAKNYGEVETEELTRLRTKGKPEVLWAGANVVSIKTEIRNVGSVEAKRITVEAVLPDGQRVQLRGPGSIPKYGEEHYSFDKQTAVGKTGRVKIDISCKNCRN